jgi:hypothetical protein
MFTLFGIVVEKQRIQVEIIYFSDRNYTNTLQVGVHAGAQLMNV